MVNVGLACDSQVAEDVQSQIQGPVDDPIAESRPLGERFLRIGILHKLHRPKQASASNITHKLHGCDMLHQESPQHVPHVVHVIEYILTLDDALHFDCGCACHWMCLKKRRRNFQQIAPEANNLVQIVE